MVFALFSGVLWGWGGGREVNSPEKEKEELREDRARPPRLGAS